MQYNVCSTIHNEIVYGNVLVGDGIPVLYFIHRTMRCFKHKCVMDVFKIWMFYMRETL